DARLPFAATRRRRRPARSPSAPARRAARQGCWRAPDLRPARQLPPFAVHSTCSQYDDGGIPLPAPILRARPKQCGWTGATRAPNLRQVSEAAAVTENPALSPPRVFYGWFVVMAAFAVTFVGFGCAYTFSAFVGPLQQEYCASRRSVALVFSLAGFLYFGLGIVSGPLADRWGARRLAVAGMILTGTGLALAGLARSLAEVYVAYGLGVGLGLGCAYVPAVGAVQRWFVKRRGLASGLAVSGIGVGTLVMPPLASLAIAGLGWRGAYALLGGLAAVVGAGMALLIEDDPRHRGSGPDGGILPPGARSMRPAGASLRAAIASRQFAGLYAACLMCSFGV